MKSGPLDYRASSILQAEYAVDVDSFEDSSKVGGSDEGLEIAKLGISPEIISALAKRGITKLFPIQVHLLSLRLNSLLICSENDGKWNYCCFFFPLSENLCILFSLR